MPAPYSFQVALNDERILNYCTKHLARGVKLFEGHIPDDAFNLTNISENWRFPIVEPALNAEGLSARVNSVTFVWQAEPGAVPGSVKAIGSFLPWYEAIELKPVTFENINTLFFAATLQLPVGKSYYYRFIIDGIQTSDPINPQTKALSNGKTWSFFFTDFYNSSEEFEDWEVSLLYRFANQVVPFRTTEAQNFINRFYLSMAKSDKYAMPIFKLDESVGEVNFITNILAREERHHLEDYKICLSILDRILRHRNPVLDSWLVSEELVIDVYNEMASGQVQGWDYGLYNNPTYFLGLIRRHTLMGAFSHPRYGGNIGGAAWNYLQERYDIKNNAAQTVDSFFNWQLALEKPIGSNSEYRG